MHHGLILHYNGGTWLKIGGGGRGPNIKERGREKKKVQREKLANRVMWLRGGELETTSWQEHRASGKKKKKKELGQRKGLHHELLNWNGVMERTGLEKNHTGKT